MTDLVTVQHFDASNTLYDLIIIGSGPAGYTAGIYASRANLKTLLMEGDMPGGQLTTTTTVENYPGFSSITGEELMTNLKKQAELNGCITMSITGKKIISEQEKFIVVDSSNKEYKTKTIILAMGASAKKLTFSNSDKYWNRGISACAVCDGALPFYKNKKIIVVGGGDTAMEQALYLSKFASKVIILVRSNKLKASNVMIEKIKKNEKIEINYNLEVIEAYGNDKNYLNQITVKNNLTNEISKIDCGGLFFGIGHTPNTSLVSGIVDLTVNGYIKKINDTTITSVKGIFAAGDIIDDNYKQAVTASSSGCMAALDCIKYIQSYN
jgi:thioredoxin reductase (NADPH)